MSWNIELACLAGATSSSRVVPDVFVETKEKLGFESATSAMRDPDLCVARVGDWTIAIDVSCRLSSNEEYLVEASAGGELYVVRISMSPSEAMYRAGKKVKLRKPKSTIRDGEQRAIAWLKEGTGVDFAKDLWSTKYTVFALDV